jgi:thioredoxin 1
MTRIIILSILVFSLSFYHCTANDPGKVIINVIQLTDAAFMQKIFNYEISEQWKYEGNIPAIVDFHAEWCRRCRVMSPIVEQIAGEFAGKLLVYKVNTDEEQKLSQSLGIISLQTILFIPQKRQAQASVGVLTKKSLIKAINDVLLIQ